EVPRQGGSRPGGASQGQDDRPEGQDDRAEGQSACPIRCQAKGCDTSVAARATQDDEPGGSAVGATVGQGAVAAGKEGAWRPYAEVAWPCRSSVTCATSAEPKRHT